MIQDIDTTEAIARARECSLLHVSRDLGQKLADFLDRSPHGFRIEAKWRYRMPCLAKIRPLETALGNIPSVQDVETLTLLVGPGDAAHIQRELKRFGHSVAMRYRRPVSFERVDSTSGVHIAARWHHLAVCGAAGITDTVSDDLTCPACILSALTPPEGERQGEYHPYGRIRLRDEEVISLRDSIATQQ